MNNRHRVIVMAVLFALTFAIGVSKMSANNSFNDLGYNCALPDADIAWYNGATGEYADIYQGEAMSDGDSWNNYTILNLTQVGSSGANDQVNSYNGSYGFTGWLGIADPKPFCTSLTGISYSTDGTGCRFGPATRPGRRQASRTCRQTVTSSCTMGAGRRSGPRTRPGNPGHV